MKNILTIIVVLGFFPILGLGQSQDFYDQALQQACPSLENLFPGLEIFIEQGILTTRFIQQKSCSKEIFIVDQSEILKRARRQEKENPFRFVRIVPLRLEEGAFYVTVIVFEAKFSRKILQLTNLYGENVYFHYDCSTQLMKLRL